MEHIKKLSCTLSRIKNNSNDSKIYIEGSKAGFNIRECLIIPKCLMMIKITLLRTHQAIWTKC